MHETIVYDELKRRVLDHSGEAHVHIITGRYISLSVMVTAWRLIASGPGYTKDGHMYMYIPAVLTPATWIK